MATQILATGSTAATSADLTVTDAIGVGLKGLAGEARVLIQLKDDAAAYNDVGVLDRSQPAVTLDTPGDYRFVRIAGAACGVFSA